MTQKKATPNKKRAAEIDWGEVHRRLETAQNTLERGEAPTSEVKKKILKARAKALAREPASTEAAEEYIEVIEFLLAHERYGLESRFVREVYPLKEFTPLPGTPAFVLGIINVRGRILSVVDIKKFFDLPQKGLTDLNKVIIVQHDRIEFGILADAVRDVRTIPLSVIQPSLPTLTGVRADYLKGVTGERLIVLDVVRILTDPRVIVRHEVET